MSLIATVQYRKHEDISGTQIQKKYDFRLYNTEKLKYSHDHMSSINIFLIALHKNDSCIITTCLLSDQGVLRIIETNGRLE